MAILVAGAAISLLPQVALALYAFPSADDYCLAVEVRGGFWRMQAHSYLTWTGRYTATLLQSLVSEWDLARVYTGFVLATWAATLLSFQAMIATLCGHVGAGRHVMMAVIVTAVFVGGLPSTVEAFYWMASAATYRWGVIAYLVWLTLLIQIARNADPSNRTTGRRSAAAGLTALLPGFNEVMVPIIFATIVAFLVGNREGTTQPVKRDRFMLMLLGIAVVSTVVSFLAPGNAIRSESYPDIATRHNLEYALIESARQTTRFFARHSRYPALWIGAIAVWWWGSHILTRGNAPVAALRRSAASLAGLVSVVYLTLFPLYWEYGDANYTGEGRTFNITYVPFCAAVVVWAGLVLGKLQARFTALGAWLRTNQARVDLLLAGTLAILMIASPSSLRAFRALAAAPEYLEAQQARESILRSPPSPSLGTVIVDAISIRPEGLFWGDIQPDESHWINSCVARYYGLGSVRSRM